MSALVLATYNGQQIAFSDEGWFNATQAAGRFNKEPVAWLRQSDTAAYITALCRLHGKGGFVTELNEIKDLDSTSAKARRQLLDLVKKTGYVRTKAGAPETGGGTWLHPKLAIAFARWLDIDFAIWCDVQIDNLLREKDDWRKLRHESASSYKVMQQILQLSRAEDGKACAPHHYSNEARLVNFALTGEFKGVNREGLSSGDLLLLAKLEEKNAVLIGRGQPYEKRKVILEQFAFDHRVSHTPALGAAREAA